MSSPLGGIIITPYFGDWQDQRAVFRAARLYVAKVHIPPGFGTEPRHVRDLLLDGARQVILRTEDDGNTPEDVATHLYERGFVDLIQSRPDIRWWIQVGNEPDVRGRGRVTAPEYRDELLAVSDALRGLRELRDVGWIAGMPITRDFYHVVMADDAVPSRYDALGFNVYGHWHIGDTGSEAQVNYEDGLRTGVPVWITETGINGALADREKGRRIVAFVNGLESGDAAQHEGVVLFALGSGTSWPALEVTPGIAAELGRRHGDRCVFYEQTGYSVCGAFLDYHERHGGVRIFGYPISPEFIEDGRTVQYFERDRFEWHPENPPEWRVLQGLLGRDAYRSRYG